MLTQRLTLDQGVVAGQVVITFVPGDVNGMAELQSLHEELKLRANIQTQGSIITTPAPEDIPPPTT
jgi:sorbitol-specific phosphotransferase system component IIA